MRILVIIVLLVILGSLASALVYLFRDRGDPGSRNRMVKALTVRVALSLGLFLLLMLGYQFGWFGRGL